MSPDRTAAHAGTHRQRGRRSGPAHGRPRPSARSYWRPSHRPFRYHLRRGTDTERTRPGMQPTDKIWRNGSFVSWEDANVHILTHALHYGTGVFEGIRAYDTPRGSAVFRLTDHLERLRRSAALYEMDLGYTVPELAAAIHETV